MLAACFVSFVFTLLIYTLTVSFGDIGKALAVVMVVIQIAWLKRNISDRTSSCIFPESIYLLSVPICD